MSTILIENTCVFVMIVMTSFMEKNEMLFRSIEILFSIIHDTKQGGFF